MAKVIIAVPTVRRPHPAMLQALEEEVPFLDKSGWEHGTVYEVGNPYISAARAFMTRKALDAGADEIIYLDHDVSWRPGALTALLLLPNAPVAAGLYRFKKETEEYMGSLLTQSDGRPIMRQDGCLLADRVPAGFLRVSREAINAFMRDYPELLFGEASRPSIDLFNHGAHNWTWYGEDYSFSRRWVEKGGKIWVLPDLDLTHHDADKGWFSGNYHQYMLRQPGGALDPNKKVNDHVSRENSAA